MTTEDIGPDNPAWLVSEVANMFRVRPSTVRKWIAEKKLKAFQLDNGEYRIFQSEVKKFATERYNLDDNN